MNKCHELMNAGLKLHRIKGNSDIAIIKETFQ